MEEILTEMRTPTSLMTRRLVHVSGLPCAGKTWLRRRIRCLSPFVVVDIEPLWHELFASPQYSVEQSNHVFERFLKRIEGHLENGASVIAESILASESRLYQLDQLAARLDARRLFVMADATRSELVRRLESKAKRRPNAVPMAVFEALERRFQTRCHVDLIVDTTKGVTRAELEPIRSWIYGTPIHSKQDT